MNEGHGSIREAMGDTFVHLTRHYAPQMATSTAQKTKGRDIESKDWIES
jgi:hypothetical protein